MLKENVNGNLKGNATGTLKGNATGNVEENLKWNQKGALKGDLKGNSKGHLIGHVKGKLKENSKGNLPAFCFSRAQTFTLEKRMQVFTAYFYISIATNSRWSKTLNCLIRAILRIMTVRKKQFGYDIDL